MIAISKMIAISQVTNLQQKERTAQIGLNKAQTKNNFCVNLIAVCLPAVLSSFHFSCTKVYNKEFNLFTYTNGTCEIRLGLVC